MANNFHDINGLLIVGIEPHFALLVPGVPIPFIPTPAPRLPKLNFLHPFVLGDQPRPTVLFNGVPAVGHWHQPKFLWPHLGLPPFPFDILTPLQVLLGVQTCWLPKTDVFAEGTMTTPCAIYGPLSINLDCWELGNFPSSLVIQPGTVQTTPTLADYLAGLKAIAIDFAINLIFNALLLGGKHLLGAGLRRLARALNSRVGVRRFTNRLRNAMRRIFGRADDAAPRPRINTGLGDEVDDIAGRSPTLRQQLDELKADGWEIKTGPSGGGSTADRFNKVITIEEGMTPAQTAQTLAHEFGHAKYPDPYVQPTGLTKDDYVSANLQGSLKDEGAATINNAAIRDEILEAGGPDVGIAGQNSGTYQSIYDDYTSGKLSYDEALEQIGDGFGSGEITSNTKQPYSEYYGDAYANHWDKLFGGP